MLFPSAYETFNSHHRCFYDSQFAVAGQESQPSQQEGHGACHLVHPFPPCIVI